MLIDQGVESGGKNVGFACILFINIQLVDSATHNKLAPVKPLRVLNHLRHKQLDVRCIGCDTLRLSVGV
jgi:site-specific DNA-cytosine methylase